MKINPYVSRVTTAVIPATTTGAQTLSVTFSGRLYLGGGCEELGNYTSPPTGQQTVEFLPLVKDGTSAEIFEGFGVPLKQLALTPAQLCVGKESLQDGDLVLIQTEVEDVILFFVAHVSFDDDGSLDVSVYEFADGGVWDAGTRHRVVVPQLDTLAS